jgi:GGDEF domain-containing protein
VVYDDPLIKSVEHSFDEEDEHAQLDHLISQLALCAPAANASFDELESFRKILLEAARALSMRSRFLDRLRSFALTDDLTGLYNRRGFLILGLQNLKLASRTGYSLLLFFVDIDQFKRVNDCLGHLEGDAFLICCAEVLKSTFRDSDIIARIGGDEFVILAQERAENKILFPLERFSPLPIARCSSESAPVLLALAFLGSRIKATALHDSLND